MLFSVLITLVFVLSLDQCFPMRWFHVPCVLCICGYSPDRMDTMGTAV